MIRPSRIPLILFAAVAALLTLRVAPSAALEIKRGKLSNGAILLVSRQANLPMVTIAIAFDAGARRDPAGKAGLASLTASCLTLGTKDLSTVDFNRKVDFMGSSVSVDASKDFAEAGMTSLKRYEGDTLALLAGALRAPALRDEDILRKRAEVVAGIRSAQQDPGYVAEVAFRKLLFGDRPYGHPSEGTADSVSHLTPNDVRNFYRQYYRLGSAVIAVVGDVDEDKIKAELEQALPDPTGTVAPQTPPPPPVVAPGIHVTAINRDVAQANLILGSPGIERSNPDYYRFQVMDYIFGEGGFASRLMKVVRSKAGLAYSIGSSAPAGMFTGSFTIVLETKNQSANQALDLIFGQLKDIRANPVTDQELSSAKKFLIGSFPLKLDRQSAIATYLLTIQLYNLGLDYTDRYPRRIEAVTKDDVQQVARKYIHPDAMVLVAVADQNQAKIDAKALRKAASGN